MRIRSFALVALALLAGCDPFALMAGPRTQISDGDEFLVPDSLRVRYQEDAARLALRSLGVAGVNQVIIPADLRQVYYNALIHVYNATTLPVRDSVVEIYRIHTWPNPEVRRLLLRVDTTLAWVQALRAGVVPTGNAPVDSLLAQYALSPVSHAFDLIVLRAAEPINIGALAPAFRSIAGIYVAQTDWWIGGGDDLRAAAAGAGIALTYDHGSGDCPAGCINHHLWTLRVDADGRVTVEN
jgi:hypothetical protein